MYNSPYNIGYNSQVSIDRINSQMAELERMKQQLQQPQQPANINQTFQIAPTNQNLIKYAASIEEVQREMVMGDTPYFSKDMSVVWIKNAKGEIKVYELSEIVEKDEKDLLIRSLQIQVDELRKEMKENARTIDADVNEPDESEKSTNVSISRTGSKKSK